MKNLIAFIIAVNWSCFSAAELLVIVNTKNPIDRLERKQVIDLYLGRVSAFPNMAPAHTLEIVDTNPLRAIFYKTLTGKNEAQVDAYWATLMFSGRMTPPEKIKSEDAIVKAVINNTTAIGYINKRPLPADVKVVMEIQTTE